MTQAPITIIGGGIAGLMAALAAAPAPVRLLNPAGLGDGAASSWSQGGLAAAIGADDSPALHIADTLKAGAGLCDGAAVRRIVEAGPALIDFLVRSGVRFDRDAAQNLARGLEAAHQRPRILHANGDQTGAEIMRALISAARATASIEFFSAAARKLLVRDGEIVGVLAETASGPVTLPADRVLLSTGGIGGLFRYSTNPPGAIGTGLILAAEAGAQVRHLEFVQFHPTALDASGPSLPLISEAVRGEGAVFIDETGARFMAGGDLAPRDVVARAVFAHQADGHRVFLDARMIGARFATRFPAISAICAGANIDPATQPIPVRPAAHYHMGGVAVDARGRTSVPGLYAAGEVACTGLHGANRLASNSLLEAAVCGAQAGQDMASREAKPVQALPEQKLPPRPDAEPVRDIMSTHLGVLRDATGLHSAISRLTPLATENSAAQLALMIAQAAFARPVSIGAHARRDDPSFANQAA
ncbi:L-aspartate oxidase [Acidocella sp.]|jgi:L-aspartate oxidase|uniref:L-aspartate oxidase n=1 Tax=Acidocella sp. TaxID=50710 RepID=UPI002F40FE54